MLEIGLGDSGRVCWEQEHKNAVLNINLFKVYDYEFVIIGTYIV